MKPPGRTRGSLPVVDVVIELLTNGYTVPVTPSTVSDADTPDIAPRPSSRWRRYTRRNVLLPPTSATSARGVWIHWVTSVASMLIRPGARHTLVVMVKPPALSARFGS